MGTLRKLLSTKSANYGIRTNLRLFSGEKIGTQKSRRDGLGIAKGYSDSSLKYILEKECLSGTLNSSKPYIVLGIETSCDDTGVAIVSSSGKILSNVVYSQYEIHQRFGGIVPSLAMEAHKNNIDKALAKALSEANLPNGMDDIDAIAVTKGPGLEICLRVGLRKAQALAREYNKTFVTVHHLEAHCLMARLAGSAIIKKDKTSSLNNLISNNNNNNNNNNEETFEPKVKYPFLVLLVSGGHTSLLLCEGMGEYTVLGGTLDDALGEAFDKAARLLGLQYTGSGGAAVEAIARTGKVISDSVMKVPMRDKPNCDFSYAGLKNSFRMEVQRAREISGIADIDSTNAPANQMEPSPELVVLPDKITADLCATFQDVAFSHLEDRIKRALDYLDRNEILANSLVVVGGVAANLELRSRLNMLLDKRTEKLLIDKKYSNKDKISLGIEIVFPPPSLCTDNGVMAAWAGIEKLNIGISNAIDNQEVIPRWPLGSPIDINSFKVNKEKKTNK